MKTKKSKKLKFKRPATGLKSRGKGLNPASAIVYHKGYVYDKLRKTTLTAYQMKEVDRKMVEATLKVITTGPEAALLPDGVNRWACKTLDQMGRVFLVLYKGIEVSLFYKRQLSEVLIQPGDRYPEGVCQDPSEAWQRLDLLGRSAKQSNIVLTSTYDRLMSENKMLSARVKTLTELNDQLESANNKVKESRQRRSK